MTRSRPWVFVIGGAQRGGAEGQFVQLASRLHEAGRPVECVFLFGGGPLRDELDRAGVPNRVLRRGNHDRRSMRLVSLVVAIVRLGVLLRRRRPEVVMAWLTFATWPTLLLAQVLTSASRVAGIRGEVLPSEVRWAGRVFRHAMTHAHAVIVNSDHLAIDAVAWGAHPTRVHVIPNGVEPAARIGDVENESSVVVANYRPYKGHADLLHALALSRSGAHVRLCGAGDTTPFEQLAVELGVSEQVHFVQHPADIPGELVMAGFAIHPSRTEGLSNAILEQLAAGLPVIAMSVGGNPMLVEHGVNGYLLEPGDHLSLARAIDALTTDLSLRQRLGGASLLKSHGFTWPACVDSYADLLGRLVESRAERSATPS